LEVKKRERESRERAKSWRVGESGEEREATNDWKERKRQTTSQRATHFMPDENLE